MAEEAKSGSRAPSYSTDDWIPDGERARDDPRRRSGASPDREERAGEGEPEPEEPRSPSGRPEGRSEQKRDEQKITAPSLGPNTVIEREPVDERLAKHEQSEVDAMGLDKRRAVVGQSYGPSKARQLGLYGAFLAVVAALLVGAIILIGHFDTSVDKVPNSAPWAQPGVKQHQPKPIQ